MTLVHAFASRGHFAAHLVGIWRALPAEIRGNQYHPGQLHPGRMSNDLFLVASSQDAWDLKPRSCIYVEHGAGQRYLSVSHGGGWMPGYSGTPGVGNVRLFLTPRQEVSERWEKAYPGVRTAVIGAPWYLDTLALTRRPKDGPVAFAWHWNRHPQVPEMRSAFPHYRTQMKPAFDLLRSWGTQLLGHGHPRNLDDARAFFDGHGIEFEPSWQKVAGRASCLVLDVSSIGYEATAIGVPTVWCNAPWYRPEVNHSLRFWSVIPGPMVDNAGEIPTAIHDATTDPHWSDSRARAVQLVYDGIVGDSIPRALTAIDALL